MTYPVGDMLIRIKNGQMAALNNVSCGYSKFKESVLSVLKEEGYITDFTVSTSKDGFKSLNIKLNYIKGRGAINDIKLVTKPGRKVYKKISEMPRFRNGLATSIISTSKGVMSDHQARKKDVNVGGLVICKIF